MGGGGRPNFSGGGRPGFGGGMGPGVGNRPGMGAGMGNRPGFANRPGAGGAGTQNPFIGNRPGFANRPGAGGGGIQNPNLPGGPTTRPGQGGSGERWPGGNNNTRPWNRPGWNGGGQQWAGGNNRPGNRPGWNGGGQQWAGGNRPWNNPGWHGGGERWPNGNRPGWNNGNFNGNNLNFNNVNNNFISNRSWNNNWQYGNWGGAGWNGGYGWGGGGYGWGGGGWGGYWNGYGNGFAAGYWDRPWYSYPLAWGLGGWALGSIFYNSGYMNYYNPYYSSAVGTPVYYDYSQPIQVVSETYVTPTTTDDGTAAPAATTSYSPEVVASTEHSEKARTAFYAGDYAAAMSEIDLALKEVPNDAAVHELRALVQFATKDYQAAAGTLYAVLSAGPGWNWTTMSSLYPSVAVYTEQLRTLEQYVKSNPDNPAGRFVLAYHYITEGHNDAAARQLKEVVRLQPSDQLSAQLLKVVGGETAQQVADQPPAATDPAAPADGQAAPASVPDIDEKQLVGKWTAKRPDGTTFSLNLSPDEEFTWDYAHGDKKGQEFNGKYSVDGAVLLLTRSDGSQMPGLVTMEKDGFNFKLYGGPENDPGLDFHP